MTSHVLLTRGYTSIWKIGPITAGFLAIYKDMDVQDNSNTPPESWDEHDDGGSGDQDGVNEATVSLSGLNVNAAPFIPGQNPYAKAFVPSFHPNVTSSEGKHQNKIAWHLHDSY